MKTIIATIACTLGLLVAAHADTVTLGSTVTLNGTFFTGNDGWPLGTNAAPADLVNGVYQPISQQWNYNSVWWNGSLGPDNNIVISLGGLFDLTALKAQADDNDTYRIEYRGLDSLWYTAWDIGAPGGWGLQTRDTTLGSIITTDTLRFTATGGDGYYAVSQIEATGTKSRHVPETSSTLALLGGALGLIVCVRRLQQK